MPRITDVSPQYGQSSIIFLLEHLQERRTSTPQLGWLRDKVIPQTANPPNYTATLERRGDREVHKPSIIGRCYNGD